MRCASFEVYPLALDGIGAGQYDVNVGLIERRCHFVQPLRSSENAALVRRRQDMREPYEVPPQMVLDEVGQFRLRCDVTQKMVRGAMRGL